MSAANNYSNNLSVSETTNNTCPDTEEYAELLTFFGAEYKQVYYHLQVGESSRTEGWVLHVSAVVSQITDVIKTVVPILLEEKVAFKIPMDKKTGKDLLNGSLGIDKIGKIITIYPESDKQAVYIVEKLIEATRSFKGPDVPNNILLDSVVYTAYQPFDLHVSVEENVSALTDQSAAAIQWPFASIKKATKPLPKKLLNGRYRPISVLKEDARGNVIFGMYLKKLFVTQRCIIKQGFKNMSSEDNGRDIYDRLLWQQEVHNKLAGIVSIPKVFDLFVEDGNSYLAIEYIHGYTVQEKKNKINPHAQCLHMLPPKKIASILDLIIPIIEIVEKLHQAGYVHRDITPENFIFDKRGATYVIDMELSYSIKHQKPYAPFELGTPGFMSPEQKSVKIPTFKEDIYGLGALIIHTLTGLSPVKFDSKEPSALINDLDFFIGNQEFCSLLAYCINPNPDLRPSLSDIKFSIEQFKQIISPIRENINLQEQTLTTVKPNILSNLITQAISGLKRSPIAYVDEIWLSRNIDTNKLLGSKEYSVQIGLNEGVAGILYLLARCYKAGFNIASYEASIKKSWNYINDKKDIPAGLHYGSYGIAFSMAECIGTNLLPRSESNIIQLKKWLQAPSTNINIENGKAGQGISLMHCSGLIGEDISQQLLFSISGDIIKAQTKSGVWHQHDTSAKEADGDFSFSYGSLGIIWFLLEYGSKYCNEEAINAAKKGVKWIIERNGTPRYLSFKKTIYNKKNINNRRRRTLLTLIKAYEILKVESYKRIAEDILHEYPTCIVKNDFTQQHGMAKLGEIYIEASRVFGTPEWQQRADWITALYAHTFIKNNKEAGYWKMTESDVVTADMATGNSGIIHFLLRQKTPNKLGYRFLS